MKKEIILQNERVAYTLRPSRRARRLRLSVYCDGSVTVTAPFSSKESTAEQFLREKAEWLLGKISFFRKLGLKPRRRFSRWDYMKYKEAACRLAGERVAHFNRLYGFSFNRINIKNQKSRWGSCSKKGNLNFNYKIALLPPALADYIVVHELCHLGEFNHSRRFWGLVAQAIPEHARLRRELPRAL